MAKERKRSNREARKPKQKKELVAVSPTTLKDLQHPGSAMKKKA